MGERIETTGKNNKPSYKLDTRINLKRITDLNVKGKNRTFRKHRS